MDEGRKCEGGEEGAPGELGGRIDRELALHDARGRPGDRREDDEQLAAAAESVRLGLLEVIRHGAQSTRRAVEHA
jgi:hypothetical protein